jgi:hypothetical protein
MIAALIAFAETEKAEAADTTQMFADQAMLAKEGANAKAQRESLDAKHICEGQGMAYDTIIEKIKDMLYAKAKGGTV